ncbi:helix-turn-helix transcriptional regulator [Streptomyces sp. NPDC059740]|uniref:helix-turn-helix transcriptional regulator n=1 Tax=Streptomyces sp. NPDC059740 TaxID=3346926 RepID=UPI00364AEF51
MEEQVPGGGPTTAPGHGPPAGEEPWPDAAAARSARLASARNCSLDPGRPLPGWRDGDADAWRNNFLALLDRVPLPIAVCEADGRTLLANPAMAAVWGCVPGRLRGRLLLDLFRPLAPSQVERLTTALRLGHRSRYPIAVSWRAEGEEAASEGELTVDPVGDPSVRPPLLLVQLRPLPGPSPEPPRPARDEVSAVEARILALAASGATTAAVGREVGLSTDGVNYHLARLARRWRVRGRTALVARAYACGVLVPGEWPPRAG